MQSDYIGRRIIYLFMFRRKLNEFTYLAEHIDAKLMVASLSVLRVLRLTFDVGGLLCTVGLCHQIVISWKPEQHITFCMLMGVRGIPSWFYCC